MENSIWSKARTVIEAHQQRDREMTNKVMDATKALDTAGHDHDTEEAFKWRLDYYQTVTELAKQMKPMDVVESAFVTEHVHWDRLENIHSVKDLILIYAGIGQFSLNLYLRHYQIRGIQRFIDAIDRVLADMDDWFWKGPGTVFKHEPGNYQAWLKARKAAYWQVHEQKSPFSLWRDYPNNSVPKKELERRQFHRLYQTFEPLVLRFDQLMNKLFFVSLFAGASSGLFNAYQKQTQSILSQLRTLQVNQQRLAALGPLMEIVQKKITEVKLQELLSISVLLTGFFIPFTAVGLVFLGISVLVSAYIDAQLGREKWEGVDWNDRLNDVSKGYVEGVAIEAIDNKVADTMKKIQRDYFAKSGDMKYRLKLGGARIGYAAAKTVGPLLEMDRIKKDVADEMQYFSGLLKNLQKESTQLPKRIRKIVWHLDRAIKVQYRLVNEIYQVSDLLHDYLDYEEVD